MPTAGPCCRSSTRKSTRTGSTSGPIPLDVRSRLRGVRSRLRRPITSPITPWPSVLFFQREFQAFRSAAERAIALNPMDGFTIAYWVS